MSGKLRARILKCEIVQPKPPKISYTPGTSGLPDFYEEFNRRLDDMTFYKGPTPSEICREMFEPMTNWRDRTVDRLES